MPRRSLWCSVCSDVTATLTAKFDGKVLPPESPGRFLALLVVSAPPRGEVLMRKLNAEVWD